VSEDNDGEFPETPGLRRALLAGVVNGCKRMEELTLRLLDDLEEEGALTFDRRMLAIGRTQIELGFMAVLRGIEKPERLAIAELDEPIEDEAAVETGWVIEEGESPAAEPAYFCGGADGPSFQADHLKAMRFARREDAEAFALMSQGSLDGVRIAEHQWG
jgi:hypothetical protein